MTRHCQYRECGADISSRYRNAKYCHGCAHKATRATQKAIRDKINSGYRPRAGRINGTAQVKAHERHVTRHEHCAYITGYEKGEVIICAKPTFGSQYCPTHQIKTLPRGHDSDSALALYGASS